MVHLLSCQQTMLTKCPYLFLKFLTTSLVIVSLYLACLATTHYLALPGGPVFSIYFLLFLGLVAGEGVRLLRIPPMLGMLVVGIALSNIPVVREMTVLDPPISSALKTVALMLILMKGGLSLDIMDIKRVGFAVIRLAFLPCFVEAAIFAILSVLLLNLPWIWGFLLGFVVSAVTPAIIVPCLMELKRRNFQVETNNISTMLISASSFDDVLAISAFMACTSSAFSSDKPLYLQILQGPLEILVGVIVGVIFGMILWILPSNRNGKVKSKTRLLLIILLGLFSVFGMNYVNFSGSGPLSVIVMSLTAIKGWKEDVIVLDGVDYLWIIGEPLLFGLVGRDIQLHLITPELLWKSLIIIFVALLFRLITAFAAVSWTGLSFKEKIFVSFSWIPKATVQAAIGSYALGVAIEQGAGETVIGYATTIVTVAVLVILVSAPLGAVLMYVTAPCLLQRVEYDLELQESDRDFQCCVETAVE